MGKWVSLHNHSCFSLLDGIIRPKALVEKVKSLGMDSVAITDHGNMSGAIEFYEAANKAKIKPILGVEAYVAPGSLLDRESGDVRAHHLVLLAENNAGYANLLKLVSVANKEGFYYKPRMDKEILAARSEGIIALSACLQGEIPYALLKGNVREAEVLLERYKAIFPGRFYLELQSNGLPEQYQVNGLLVELARRTNTPLVATNDCHYLERGDARLHEAVMCLQTQKTLSSPDRLRYGSEEFFVKSPEEMIAAFSHAPEAIRNTLEIAERCNVKLSLGENRIPKFPVPEGKTPEGYLREKAEEGLAARFEEKRRRGEGLTKTQEKEYRKRLAYELSVIEKMGFPGYFLIVWDFIAFARGNGIPVGPGRGSAAGSLVAYSLRITELDPIPHSLLFERFLNPDRISLPDIDSDFCKNRREEVVEYVKRQYGEECVAQICAFGSMKARAAVRDIGRVLDMPYGEVDVLAKLIPAALDMTLDKAIQMEPRLAEQIEKDHRKRELFDMARGVEGMVRHSSTHAAGVVIGDRPIDEVVPLLRQSDNSITTAFDMKSAEKAGLVKFDFLGLSTLTVIRHALDLIFERTGEKVDLNLIPMGDPETFALLQAGDTNGVFQAESSGFTDLLVKLRPERFSHLIDMVALYRPGPLQSGMVEDFINRRHGRSEVKYLLPELEPILKDTYGVILYQEQVMQIGVAVGGFTPGQADSLRKAMGKKLQSLMEEFRTKFVDGARAKRIDEKIAAELFELMAQFAAYGFNKSHSAAYALIAYQTAYLKAHYPVEFMTALLTCEAEEGKTAKVMRYMHYCRSKGIEVLPPDVNESRHAFHPVGEKIRFGLTAIKGLGGAALETITEAKKAGAFTSVKDFVSRVDLRKVNKKVLECLTKAGAFDSLDPDRGGIFAMIPDLIDEQARAAKQAASGQFSLFGGTEVSPAKRPPQGASWTRKEIFIREKEAVGFFVTGHPIEEYQNAIRDIGAASTVDIDEMEAGEEVYMCLVAGEVQEKAGRNGMWGLVTAEDAQGIVTLRIFGDLYREVSDLLKSGEPFCLHGRIDENEVSKAVIADVVVSLPDAIEEMTEVLQVTTEKESAGLVPKIRKLFTRYPGEKGLILTYAFDNGRMGKPENFRVRPSAAFETEIRNLLGYDPITRKVNRAFLLRRIRRGGERKRAYSAF